MPEAPNPAAAGHILGEGGCRNVAAQPPPQINLLPAPGVPQREAEQTRSGWELETAEVRMCASVPFAPCSFPAQPSPLSPLFRRGRCTVVRTGPRLSPQHNRAVAEPLWVQSPHGSAVPQQTGTHRLPLGHQPNLLLLSGKSRPCCGWCPGLLRWVMLSFSLCASAPFSAPQYAPRDDSGAPAPHTLLLP